MDLSTRHRIAQALRAAAAKLSGTVNVKVDFGKYKQALFEYLDDLFTEYGVTVMDRDEAKHPEAKRDEDGLLRDKSPEAIRSASAEEAENAFKGTEALVATTVKRLEDAVRDLPTWNGSHITAKLIYEQRFKNSLYSESMPTDPVGNLHVYVHASATPGRSEPSFTLFDDGTVGDVLDVGDLDFFNDPLVEQDYFALVSELQNPGSSKKLAQKRVKLYTARPIKDRALYDKLMQSKQVPSGIFLATHEDKVEGLAHDLSGGEGRDIYRIVMHLGDLIETNRSGSYAEYQAKITPSKLVPVLSIERVYEAPEE